jgi:DNA-binding transcriptional MerR regulator
MFPISELSARTNVPAKTIRYYEAIGLLAPARRSPNGYRVYDRQDAERLSFIRSARACVCHLIQLSVGTQGG